MFNEIQLRTLKFALTWPSNNVAMETYITLMPTNIALPQQRLFKYVLHNK